MFRAARNIPLKYCLSEDAIKPHCLTRAPLRQDVREDDGGAVRLHDYTHLCDEELGEPLGQPALLTGEDHLQHVPVQLLHHHKHFLRGLEHALQVHDSQVTQTLPHETTE